MAHSLKHNRDEQEEFVAQEISKYLRNPHKPAILAMSRPDPKKNITTLVKAFGENKTLRGLANLVLIMVSLMLATQPYVRLPLHACHYIVHLAGSKDRQHAHWICCLSHVDHMLHPCHPKCYLLGLIAVGAE